MLADRELARVVADDHRVLQEAVRRHRAPQRSFGGDAHRIGCDLQLSDAETPQMGLPGRVIDEASLPLGRQAAEHRPGERAAAHIGQGRRVDHILAVAGAQQVEEVEPALARPRAEPGEGVVTDLRAEAVAASVPGAGVVHGDPGSGLQPRP